MANPVKKRENMLPVAYDYGEMTGVGNESMKGHIRIPFINLLQKGSRQIDTNPEAKPGLFVNNITDEIVAVPFDFVVVDTHHAFVEWIPQDNGGGFVGEHTSIPAGAVKNEKGKHILKGNEIVETTVLFGVMIRDGVMTPSKISCYSTKLGALADYQTRLETHESAMIQTGAFKDRNDLPPVFARRITVTSEEAINKKSGKPYQAIVFNPSNTDFPSSQLNPEIEEDRNILQAAFELRKQVKSGEVAKDMAESKEEAF